MSVRRQMNAWGVRLAVAAGDPEWIRTTRGLFLARLTGLLHQVQRSHGAPTGLQPPTEPLRPPADPATPALAATHIPERLVARAEHRLIHTVLAHPDLLDHGTVDRLHPEDFATPAHANTWRALLTTTARGEPADPILIGWETERHAAHHHRAHPDQPYPTITTGELVALAAEPADPNIDKTIATVIRGTLARLARHAHQRIHHMATDPSHPITDVIAAAWAATDHLETQAQRLTRPSPIRQALAGAPPTTAPGPATPADTQSRRR
jgi:hypothetical protein